MDRGEPDGPEEWARGETPGEPFEKERDLPEKPRGEAEGTPGE